VVQKAEGIARNAVIRILSLPEVQRAINRTRSLILHQADQLAERLMAIALGKSKKGGRQALVDLLRSIGVWTAKFEVSDLTEQEYDHSSSMFLYGSFLHCAFRAETRVYLSSTNKRGQTSPPFYRGNYRNQAFAAKAALRNVAYSVSNFFTVGVPSANLPTIFSTWGYSSRW
jgi:hypothetical protein